MIPRWLRSLATTFAIILATVGLPGGAALAAPMTSWSDLVAAVDELQVGESADLTLDTDVTVPSGAAPLVVREGTKVTLAGEGTVTGSLAPAVTVEKGGELTLEGPSFTKTQFDVKGDLSFVDGAIRDTSVTGPVIFVEGGTLTIDGTAEFSNNSVADTSGALPEGVDELRYAPITAYNGTINVKGGTLTGNAGFVRGGAIGLWARDGGTPTLEMSGGTISGNKVVNNDYFSYGGGIYAEEASLTISGGAIKDNHSADHGGGIALVASEATMTGGVIEANANDAGVGGGLFHADGSLTIDGTAFTRNVSAKNGGGIYTQGDANVTIRDAAITENSTSLSGGGISFGGTTVAHLYAANLTGNTSKGFWGGGAIYNGTHADVTIYNALIRNNKIEPGFLIGANNRPVSAQGGGVWNCPTGKTTMYVTKGVAIYENAAPNVFRGKNAGAGDDFASIMKHEFDNPTPVEGNPVVVTDRMLGGSHRTWYQDGSIYSIHSNWSAEGTVPRYSADDSTTMITPNQKITDNIAFKSVPSDDAKDIADTLATVRIEDNTAAGTGISGAGIANNGNLVFGEEEPWTLKIVKAWVGDKPEDRPESITFDVMLGDKKLESVTLTDTNGWTTELSHYPDPNSLIDARTGEKLELTFVEHEVDGYVGHAPKVTLNNETQTYEVKALNTPPTSVDVRKKWSGDVEADRPDAITVNLYADGTDTGQTLTLSADNNWEGTFTNLPKYTNDDPKTTIVYTITETPVPGYTTHITGTPKDGYTITNTKDVPPPSTPPTTPPSTPPTTPPSTPPSTPPTTPPSTPPLVRTGFAGYGLAAAGALLLVAGALLVSRRRRT